VPQTLVRVDYWRQSWLWRST